MMDDDFDLPGSGVMIVMGPCIGCGRPFMFDAEWVPSVYWVRVHEDGRPVLSTSLDMALAGLPEIHEADQTGDHTGPQAGCVTCTETARVLRSAAVREPICPACCAAANPERARNGLGLLPTHDTVSGP